jgi:2-oxoisovalerate dehydrogenase E2 component (dihydrolipoyl transacylase)
MGTFSFKLPDLGEGIVESEIAEWHVAVGDMVEEDDHIADVMTDKAVVEVSAPVSGKVIALACESGEVLAVGSELIRFETDSDTVSEDKPAESKQSAESAPAETAQPQQKQMTPAVNQPSNDNTQNNSTVLTSPSVRRRAKEQNIDLTLVTGSGKSGRIYNSDLDNFIATGGSLAARPMPVANTQIDEIKIKGLRRVIAQKMVESKQNIPHYSYVEEVDVTQLEELRQTLNAERQEHQQKLTLLPFLVIALNKVLGDFPHCNALYDDDTNILSQYRAVHAGIATMTSGGLMVPVIKHSEQYDIWQVANEMNRVTQAARDGKAKADELSGSTITITSLGAIGGVATTPVINAPETSIIGVNKMIDRPVVINGQIVVRKMMNLSASFDHRIVDGFDGAMLVQAIKKKLEVPGTLFV